MYSGQKSLANIEDTWDVGTIFFSASPTFDPDLGEVYTFSEGVWQLTALPTGSWGSEV